MGRKSRLIRPCEAKRGDEAGSGGGRNNQHSGSANRSKDGLGDKHSDGAGLVNPLDVGFVLARFGCDVGAGDPSCDIADMNGDGLVDPLTSASSSRVSAIAPCRPQMAGLIVSSIK